MANLKSILFFLILLQVSFITNGQSALKLEIAKAPALKTLSSIQVHDIPTTITTPPNISYLSPQVFAINKPINLMVPNNTGGNIPAANYGQNVASIAFASALNQITGIVAEADGTLYAANYDSHEIMKVSPNGVISRYAGPVGYGTGANNGPLDQATFDNPDALVRDASGNLFVSDLGNNLIRKITRAGMVSTFAGNGTRGATNSPIGTMASFNYPRGMAIDATDNIYLADQGNNLIRKITPSGAVTTFAGTGSAGFTNGNIATATFDTPTAVGIDNAGNLYVADTGNGAVRKIATDGTVTTVATGLDRPRELRVDATNNIYVIAQNAGQLLRISPNGTVSKVADELGLTTAIALVLDGKGYAYVGRYGSIYKVSISGFTIDKPLPTGLSFNPQTGIITGTPTVMWPATNYTITAYNGGGSYSTTVNIAVDLTAKVPSVINFPVVQPDKLDQNNNYAPAATSNNLETPITFTSSNPAVATITPEGLVHLVGPGISTITANQAGNQNYTAANPVSQILTVIEHLYVDLPAFSAKTICSADFNVNAFIGDKLIPVTYTSSNTSVATISAQGDVKIVGPGTTTITILQNTTQQYYVSAIPKSQALTVGLPPAPQVSISPVYSGQCAGSAVTFTATGSNGGANPLYQWRVNNVAVNNTTNIFSSTTFKDGDQVTCTLINNDSPCLAGFPATSNTSIVALTNPVNTKVSIASSVNYVFPGTSITITANVTNGYPGAGYQWYVNGLLTGSNTAYLESKDFADGDEVRCVVAPANTCSLPAESQTLTIHLVDRVEIPNAFTPNADGINDTWFIKGLLGYPNCLVSVFDRNGQLLHRSKGYNTDWDGTTNGKSLPAATYYYVIDLNFQKKVMSGYVTILK
ncbi:T9SS type B sorting domain-containing protein [Mucilaginibacter auburnensis]|uniref:Gliding motility-associated-like protein n=1 Tax=Mucilaginibacter auburnensis TaxID=1457233 RepID=A0A2H9VQM4_9SPHI|nr:gliding motility-associated C-terminal domain-containing protein [Mucilaginibacter auburnensis]PJJ83119.1 gliding motility-associated-like protein [Mucilaginibacter auburnensis]